MAALFLTYGLHSVHSTSSLLRVFTATNFGFTATFIVLEINVIPSRVLLSFAAQGLQSLSERLEFIMTSIPACSRTGERGDLIIANFAIQYLYRYAKKFRN